MEKRGYKDSIFFLKERFINGCPRVKRWALEALMAQLKNPPPEGQQMIDFPKANEPPNQSKAY